MVEPVAHIRQSQHWTRCGRRVRLVSRCVDGAYVRALVRRERLEPGEPPEGVCPACYRRWREDPARRR